MSRTVTSVQSIIDASHATICHLVQLEFASGTIYLTDAGADVTWGGNTYTAVGNMGNMAPIRETSAPEAVGVRFELAGPLSGYVATALGEHVQGLAARIYVAFFNANHVVVDAVLEWLGRIDTMVIEDGVESARIIVNAESRLADWQRPKTRRHNAEDQHIDYPADEFYSFLPKMVEAEIVWPSASYFRQ